MVDSSTVVLIVRWAIRGGQELGADADEILNSLSELLEEL